MNKGKQNGITLIALIITIIVMLILVAVAVTSVSKSGLFDHARSATNQWSYEQERELNLGDDVDSLIGEYVNDYYLDTEYHEHNVVLKNKKNDKQTIFQKAYITYSGEKIEITDCIYNASEHFWIEEGEEDYKYCSMYDAAEKLVELGYIQNTSMLEKTEQEITLIKDGIPYTGKVTISVCDL